MIPICHMLRYQNMPDLARLGIREAKFMGHHELFPRVDGVPDASGWIDEPRVRGHLQGLDAGTLVHLDIESAHGGVAWRTIQIVNDKIKFRRQGMERRMRLLDFCRKVNRRLKYGFYREPDCWGRAVLVSDQLADWYDYAYQLAPLLRDQDNSYPQFYFNRFHQSWPRGLDQAVLWMERHFRALHFCAPSTDIMPVIWPVWYDLSKENPGEQSTPEHRDRCAMPGHAWRTILNYAMPRSDGLLLWGGSKAPWNPAAEWWKVLEEVFGLCN